MTPTHALTAAALVLALAWGVSVLLPAAWRAHRRGIDRVRAAERRQRELFLYAPARVLWGRPDPGGVHGGSTCAHGASWADTCVQCVPYVPGTGRRRSSHPVD